MSTVTASQSPYGVRARMPVVDPATAVARTRPHTSIAETLSQTFSMAWRALKKMRRARSRVPHNDCVRVHRRECVERIHQ